MADQAINIRGKRPLEDRDDPAAKRRMCLACMMLLDPYVQVGCNRCNGSFCSRPACYAAHLLANDAAGHPCCTRNSAQCNACGARYCTANCANQHTALGADAAGHACCPTNSAQCNACGAGHCTANCSNQHTALGADVAGHPCCPTNSAECNACGARHCTANCANQHTALGADAAGHPCCPTNSAECNVCKKRVCSNCQPTHTQVADAKGHRCCPGNASQCPSCNAVYCHAECKDLHFDLGKDLNDHPCCPSNSAECSVCKKRVCGTCQPSHLRPKDKLGHDCCAGNSDICTYCSVAFCKACQTGHQITLGPHCGHTTCVDVKVKCAGCVKEYCPACVPAKLTIDLCTDCMNPATIKVDNINVQYQTCPGTKAARSRQTTLEGPISHTGSNRSGTPPPPLVSGKIQNNDDIEELKQFDRGHLVALEIDGADSYRCIVPMNRQFNQSGKWRTMERTIGKLIDGVDQKNVDGGTVKGGTGSDATLIDLSLRTANTVDRVWHIEIILYYDDKVGDPRIPVWFYVCVYCNKKLRTHFSLGNRCSKAATIPDEQEIIEFWAAKNLFTEFLGFSVPNQKKISIEEETRRYYKPYGQPKSPPNQLLEFMDEVNQRCRVKAIPLVFTKMPSTTIRPRTAYDDVQREILRKFNRWKNGGELKSDIPSGDIYPGEPADAWQTLDECGGRASPEVDHIEPSYQQGSNSYVNGRLISFYHNHLYREKKTRGSESLNVTMLRMYNAGEIALMDASNSNTVTGLGGGVVAVTLLGSNVVRRLSTAQEHFDSNFSDDKVYTDPPNGRFGFLQKAVIGSPFYDGTISVLRKDRQAFLDSDWQRQRKQRIEEGLTGKYTSCARSFKAGFDAFVNTLDHPGRVDLLNRIGLATIKLCAPSDVLKSDTAGIQNLEATPVYAGLDEGTAQGKQAYTDLVDRFKALKAQLGIP